MKLCFTLIIVLLGITESAFAQYNITYAGKVNYADTILLSGCWGYTADDGKEYALVGTTHGTSIVDVSNPLLPEELFFVPGPLSTWREVKTWNKHAYVTTEGGGGLMIIDLQNLPDAIDTISYHGTVDHPFKTAHTLIFDEFGFGYLFGFNILTGANEGAHIIDVNVDPKHPEFVAEFTDVYVHDGLVRDNKLWAAAIYEGGVYVYDVTDKNDFVLLGVQPTSASATHNCWLSDDGNYLFTTDEIWTGFITSFDVTDVTDIKTLDQIKHGAADSTVAHNTYYLNGYLVTAHYTEGVTIHDAQRPGNLIEVGHYDTSPFGPEVLLEGAWGVYPYFPSGTIIISDIGEGLIVLQPTYTEAAFLEGTVKDEVSFGNIIHAQIEISGTPVVDSTDIFGIFETGYHEAGTYDIIVSKAGCVTKTITGVELINGEVTNLDITLDCGTLAIGESPENKITCYYLPDNGIIYVNNQNDFSNHVNGRLINSEGKLIQEISLAQSATLQLDVNVLPKGLYYFEFYTAESTFTKKLMLY